MNTFRRGLGFLTLGLAVILVTAGTFPVRLTDPGPFWYMVRGFIKPWIAFSAFTKVGMVLNQKKLPLGAVSTLLFGISGILTLIAVIFNSAALEISYPNPITNIFMITLMMWVIADFYDTVVVLNAIAKEPTPKNPQP